MEDAKTILRKGIDCWNAHDREGFLALFDDAVTYFDQPTGKEFVGREALGERFYDLWTVAYPDNTLKDPIVFGERELVCFQGHFVGTHTGIFRRPEMELELPPTGKLVDAPFVFIAEIRDDKVVRAWHYYDRLLALEQEEVFDLDKLFEVLPVA
ncbi:MAG TPA: ester cyclase [Gaiellaceae bacterium]|nr:ester cyclase [Gaiellaceae bacterium]